MTTLTVGALVAALGRFDAVTPVYLDVLGDLIDVEGIFVPGDGTTTTAVHLVGAEVEG